MKRIAIRIDALRDYRAAFLEDIGNILLFDFFEHLWIRSNRKHLLRHLFLQHPDIIIGLYGFLLISNKVDITKEVEADPSDTTYQISEINRLHLAAKYLVVCDEEIVRRQVYALQQSAGTEHNRDMSLLKQRLYPCTNRCWQITDMVCDALSNHVGKEIITVDFLPNIFCECLQQLVILYPIIPKSIREFTGSVNRLISTIEVHDGLLPLILRQAFVHFLKPQQDVCKVSAPTTTVTDICNMDSFSIVLVIYLYLLVFQINKELHLHNR